MAKTKLQTEQVSDSLRVTELAYTETATNFISKLKVADGASYLATLAASVVFITQWHLKDDKDTHKLSLSAIRDCLKKEITDLFPKAKRYFGFQVIADAQKLATKLCYRGDRPQYAGAVHAIVETHSPEAALDALKAWLMDNEGVDGIWKLQQYTGTRKTKAKNRKNASATNDPNFIGDLVTEMATVKTAIDRTEDATVKQDLIERASSAIVVSMPDLEQGAKALFEEAGHKDIEVLERILKMGEAILSRMLEEKTSPVPMTKEQKAAAKAAAKEASKSAQEATAN